VSARFRNRLTGKEVKAPEGRVALGQYQLLVDQSASLNSVRVQSGDFLIPDRNGQWSLLSDDTARAISGGFMPNQFPLEREQSSLYEIGERLQKMVATQATWQDWISISPIVPEVLEKAQMQPFDRAIRDHLWHLQDVCRDPRTHLKLEVERLPVSRARRIAQQAVEYLASHTEDWQHRKLRSVVPKRILSVVADDQLNIYENRVAARLIDHLHRYLRRRIEEIYKIQFIFDVRTTTDTNWRRRNRVLELLGQAVRDHVEGRRVVRRTQEALEGLHYEVLQLFDSPLYRAIPRQAQVPPTLKATNIFANDRHYRYVSLLWRVWLQYGFEPPKSPIKLYDERQDLCKGFDLFCTLLICRALHQLGLEAKDTSRLVPGGEPLLLQNKAGGDVLLEWREDGTLSVTSDGRELARFVPLVAALTGAPNVTVVEQQLHDLIRPVQQAQLDQLDYVVGDFNRPSKIILYSGDSKQRQGLPTQLHLRLQSIGNDLRTPTTVGLVPVSTYEIDSVERVARALRWVLLGSQILSYPLKIPIPVSHADDLLRVGDWLQPTDRWDTAKVTRLPRPDEVLSFEERLSEEIGKLDRRGKTYQHEVRQLEDFRKELEQVRKDLNGWLQCPVCSYGNESRAMKALDDDHFVCTCVDCSSTWGTRACGNCGRRYPFLAASSIPQTDESRHAGWVDDVIGMDALATPCWLPGAEGVHICPWCGVCSNADHPEGSGCERCASP
jgi:transcription elongation factor Elf1